MLRTENRGVAAARNLGVGAARGPVLAFLDHDDLWLPGHLARAVPHLLAAAGRFVYEDVVYFGDPAREGERYPAADHLPARTYAEAWRRIHLVTPGQVVVRRADVLAAGGFPEDRALSGADDRVLWLALVARGVLPEPTRAPGLRYRLHPGQASRRRIPQKRARLRAQETTAAVLAGDPPRPRIAPEVAAPYLAELGLDLAHDLLDEDAGEAEVVAAAALGARPGARGRPALGGVPAQAGSQGVARMPVLGPVFRALRRLRRRG